MVLIEGRRREPALQPQPGQKRAAEDAAQAAAKQPRTDAPNLGAIIAAAQAAQAAQAGGAPAPNPAPAAPAANASSPQAAAVIAALVAAQQQAPGAAQSPQLAAITAAIAAARQAAPAPGAAPPLGGLAATPGLPTQPGAMPPVAGLGQTVPVASAALAPGQLTAPAPAPTALPASTALPPTGLPAPAIPGVATAPPAPTVPAAPIQTAAALPTAPGIPTAPTVAPAPVAPPPPNPQAAAILSQLAGGATGAAPATSQSAVLAALAAQNAGAQPAAPAAPPNPQALALLQALAEGALGGAQTGAPAAPAAAPASAAAPTSTLTPQAAAVIAALVARQQQQASQAPGIQPASLALAPQTAAPAPPSGSGQIDLFAHLAASARINAAMNAAYAPAEEEQLAEVVPEPAAFDKDALARLAQRAAEGPIEDEPPPPPPPEHKKPVEDLALAPVDAGAVAAVDVPMEVEVGDAGIAGPDIQQDAEMNGMLQLPAPEVEVKKKDSSSIATMLSYAQSNVAKGKVPSDKAVDTASLQQAFTIGGGASGHTSFSMKGLSPLDSLLHRLDSAGVDLPSEDRKDLQQQITSLLPKLDPAKTADLVSKLQGADGLRSSAFLDEIAKMLPASRFASPHLTRILATLATWAAAVSGSDADGKPKLSEDARSFFTTAAAELSLRLMDVAPKDLSQIASAMATIGQTEERFFASLARASVARAERFAVEDILLLCMAFDKAGLVHVPLLEAAAKLLRHQVSQVSGPDLAKGLKGLATCCVRDLELGKAVGEYLAEGPKGGLTSEEFCSLAWTFVTLGFYHDQMFRAVFKALEDAPSMPGDTLCQLYEIHLALKAFRDDLYGKYELEDAAVQSLKAHYRKQRGGKLRDVKLDRSMEKVCKDIADSLQKVVTGSVSRQHQTELGMAVDIAVTKKGSKPIVFIEVDGSHSLMRTLDLTGPSNQISRVRGPVLLKRYLLQKHGFRIAVVPEDFWRSLPDSREKRDFLRELLRSAGVPSKLL